MDFETHRPDEIQNVRQKEINKGLKRLATLRLYPGQFMWELDLTTGAVEKAIYEDVVVNIYGEVKKKLVMKDHGQYVMAINKKNAVKKFLRGLANA